MATTETRLDIYERMYRCFAVDRDMRNLIMSGKVAVVYYSPRGQEAVPAAVSAAGLDDSDYIATTYRGLHDTIAKGANLREVVAEITARSQGTCKGKGGIMHLTDPRVGVMVTSGIVGGAIPISNGLALRSQLTGSNAVTVSYFGDGATNIGAFHESLNMAAVWKLPVIFVCQNNEYGEFTPRMESMCVEKISTRADAYGIPGVTVDGNDPDAVYEAARTAIDRARGGAGPTLIEAKTYRFMGHVYGLDKMEYMPKDEFEAAVAADPVPAYRKKLIEDGAASDEVLGAIEHRVNAQVSDAVDFALASPPPAPNEAYTDVYAEEVPA